MPSTSSLTSHTAISIIWHPDVLGRIRLWFTCPGCGHQRNKEKLLFGLALVAQEFTTGSVFLLTEIKHHIKTQCILEGKDKNTKRACLIFRNAILSFVSSGIQLARLPSLFKSFTPTPSFAIFRVCFHECAWTYVHVPSLNSHTSVNSSGSSNSSSRKPGSLINCTQDSASTSTIGPSLLRGSTPTRLICKGNPLRVGGSATPSSKMKDQYGKRETKKRKQTQTSKPCRDSLSKKLVLLLTRGKRKDRL